MSVPRAARTGLGLAAIALVLLAFTPAADANPRPADVGSLVGSQGVDTSLAATDSQVTVGGRGAFSGLQVTVNQTQKLNNQAVSITWTGGAPTITSPGTFTGNFLRMMFGTPCEDYKPNDVLVLFVSSHGKIVENRFKILQTGYNPKYDRLTIDFKSDILETLSPLNCKKLIFLDACHSGGAKEGFGGVSQAVVELAKTQPGVSTLTSCGSTEKSYEDKSWENGAFTEALLDAFADKTCTDATGAFQADADRDHILRLGELYEFLRRRVPALVQGGVPNAPTSQTPFMPESELDKNLPLFLLENH